LKGSLTALAAPATVPAGDLPGVLLAAAGTSRLATAGTGDVLSGIIGAMVARGLPVLMAGALGAHVHGRASGLGHGEGLVAGDLPGLVADWLSEAMGDPRRRTVVMAEGAPGRPGPTSISPRSATTPRSCGGSSRRARCARW